MDLFWNLDCQLNFTMGMIQELGGVSSPMLISPWSIFVTMLAAYFGGGEILFVEYAQFAMCIPGFNAGAQNITHLRKSAHDLVLRIGKEQPESDFLKLYVQRGFSLNSQYLVILRDMLDGIEVVDFENKDAANFINNDISNMTNQKVNQFVNEVTPNTKLFIASSMLFQNTWKVDFNEPKHRTFYVDRHSTKSILMMQQTSKHFAHYEDYYFRVVRIPFNASDQTPGKSCMMNTNRANQDDCNDENELTNPYTFLIFMPQKRFGLAEALPHLTKKTIMNAMSAHKAEINLTIPSFEFEYTAGFKNALQRTSFVHGFDPETADFSLMTLFRKLYIGDFVQKTKVEINSKRVDIGIAHADKMIPQRRSKRSLPKEIEVNQPFVYVIILRSQQTIMHVGVFT